jgi:hypothetical protein
LEREVLPTAHLVVHHHLARIVPPLAVCGLRLHLDPVERVLVVTLTPLAAQASIT